ncbi:MAG: rhodanese-like domain-containing protein [Lachnospiraceae bacterium]|nr:rhodanese-like domain-containing protein [Lachnospiraceae bacterium]
MNFLVIYPKDIERLQMEKRALIVDIRLRNEYQKGHWKGAINYPEEEINDYTSVLKKNRMIILYCEHGGSSMQIARTLGKKGYQVGTVVGGYEAIKKFEENYLKNH